MNRRNEIKERVMDELSEVFGVDRKRLTERTPLNTDDPEVMMADLILQHSYRVHIQQNELDGVKTIADLIDLINRKEIEKIMRAAGVS